MVNKEEMPIFLPTVLNSEKECQRIGVGLSLVEDGDAGIFMLSRIKAMSPGWHKCPTVLMDSRLSPIDIATAIGTYNHQICTWHWLSNNLFANLGKLRFNDAIKMGVYGLKDARDENDFHTQWARFQEAWPAAVSYMTPYVDKKHQWAAPWVNKHFNNGSTVSSPAEASNWSFMSWMFETRGNLILNLEWSLLQEQQQSRDEKRRINNEVLGMHRK